MIQQGGWAWAYSAQLNHTPLCFASSSTSHIKLDEAFKVDVKKSRKFSLTRRLRNLSRPCSSRPIARQATATGAKRKQLPLSAVSTTAVRTRSSEIRLRPRNRMSSQPIRGQKNGQHSATIVVQGIKLRVPVDTHVNPDSIHVEAVETIMSGDLWEPAMRSDADSGFVPAVSNQQAP